MKVGFTEDEFSLIKRMKSYVSCNPDVILIGTIEGDIKKERSFHKMQNYIPIKFTNEFTLIQKDILRKFINDETFVERNLDDLFNFTKNNIAETVLNLRKQNKMLHDGLKAEYKQAPYLKYIYEHRDDLYSRIGFNLGAVYSGKYIREKMRQVYSEMDIHIEPKPSTLYTTKNTTIRENGKIIGAYKIIGRKYK